MRQDISTNESRDCWSKARDRNRAFARYAIRQRVLDGTSLECDHHFAAAEIQATLLHIIDGDRSYFSLPYLHRNVSFLDTPFPVAFLWEESPEGLILLGEEKLKSWFGVDGMKELETFLDKLDTITYLEYATWIRRYFIVGAFLLGGINPCVRGKVQGSTGDRNDMKSLGTNVLKCFFDSVPLPLSTYVVKCAVEMRRRAIHESTSGTCSSCSLTVGPNSFLALRCHHHLCETCFWGDIVENLHHRDGDVIACSVCTLRSSAIAGNADRVDPQTILHHSLSKYLALPEDANALKASKYKKQKVKEPDFPCSTWADAVKPSLGSTKDVRRDKFFTHVEKGAYHFVKGSIHAGIDLNLQNEYGQTALYISAWKGYDRILVLLLDSGANPYLMAHGNMSPLGAAAASANKAVADVLKRHVPPESIKCSHYKKTLLSAGAKSMQRSTLIERDLEHPGAGAYCVDSSLTDGTAEAFVQLWRSLPTDRGKQRKEALCSLRSYYCDAEGLVTRVLSDLICDAFSISKGSVLVFPHMRFLCYDKPSTALAPHVDLCRMDLETGQRSTHTFLFYLSNCNFGGGTVLLEDVKGCGRNNTLARIAPRVGRLLLFPHACPHEGEEVQDIPKLLIRGEIWLPIKQIV